jgi:cell division protein FtsW
MLVTTGILFVYSASAVYALEHYGNPYYCLKRHLIGILVGTIALVCGSVVPIQVIKKASPYTFMISILLTALTMVPGFGHRIHGSSRWLNVKGFSFQPSELMKIMLIIYLAYFFERHAHKGTRIYVQLLVIVGIVSGILLKQPDFGMTVTVVSTALILLLCSQIPFKHIAIGIAATIPTGLLLIALQPYRMQRILVFLNPWNDPHGSGFQIIQSLIAIGSGGLWGLGIGYSKQKFFYLPMQHTDFIFAIIAEETGLLGSCLLVIIYFLFLRSGIRLALNMKSHFAFYTTLGITALISLQSIINIAVATGLAPTKGLGLPFISYGNTALVCNLFMIGIIINLTYSNNKKLLPHM